jgi:D-3-phosphoglycerate dehydrogenase / 2-oxoglutarate reductase
VKTTSLAKSKIKVVLLEGVHASAVEAFHADGYTDVAAYPASLAGEQLAAAIRGAYFLGIRSATQLTAAVLDRAPKLIGIGCFCIGTNQVDLDHAQGRGIPVFNAPFSNTRSVAELVIAEMILLVRGVPRRNAELHRGVWNKSAAGAHEVRGKCFGIVGYGHIGTQVGVLAEALGMRVIYYDIVTKLALGNATPVKTLDDLLAQADVVTLHVPDTPVTRGFIGARELALMRPGAALINASRGLVVNIDALAGAIETGHLGGAALDVFPKEPAGRSQAFESPLCRFDQVLLTPHIGGSTEEAQESIGREVADKLIGYSNFGSTLTAVNFPEVSLTDHPGMHRLIHIHQNRPGLLSQINNVFSRHDVNICSESLETNARLGYVVVDVEASSTTDTRVLREELEAIDGTIRTRLLY